MLCEAAGKTCYHRRKAAHPRWGLGLAPALIVVDYANEFSTGGTSFVPLITTATAISAIPLITYVKRINSDMVL